MAKKKNPAEEIAADLLHEYGKAAPLSGGMRAMIQTLAAVINEENMLQAFVNEHGTCYQVTGKSGDVYSRSRPEWQQLKEARLRKQSLINLLESKVDAAPELDEVDALLQLKHG